METKAEFQTGEYLRDEISIIIDETGSRKILGVVTDNASDNLLVYKLLDQKYKEHNIQFYGCAGHIFNLLAKDICKISSAEIKLSKASNIVTGIKKSKLVLAKFREIKKKT